MSSLFAELRRRNVFKVGAAYAVVAWLLIQIAVNVFPPLQLPAWTVTFVTVLLLIGFPIALLLAWAYELTPEGIRKTRDVPHEESVTRVTGQKLNYVVTGLLVLAVGYLVTDNYVLTPTRKAADTPTAGGVQSSPTGAPASVDRPREVLPNSVAVLPFDNLSPNPDDAYFAAGIHEEILNYLAKVKLLNVIARTSMLRYANSEKTVQQIAAELNVKTVMEGSIRYADGRVRVTAQLIDATTGTHLWSEAYEREFKDIFAVQADIAMNVANALNATFSPAEQQRIERAPNVPADTYAKYLRIVSDMVAAGDQAPRILALLDAVIAEAPEFPAAYARKAGLYANLSINTVFGLAGERAEMEALARSNAERALALDPNDEQATSALVLIDLFGWRWKEAESICESFYRATGRYADSHDWLMMWTGRAAQGIEIAQRGVELNPVDPLRYWYLGASFAYAGQPQAAADALRHTIDIVPTTSLFHLWLALAEVARNEPDVALRELRLAERLLGDNRASVQLAVMTYAYGRLGGHSDAERIFAEVQGIAAGQDIGTGGWAMAYLGVGEQDKALEQLRLGAERARKKALDPSFLQLMNIRMNVTADPVLEQPEFVAVREQLKGD